MQQPLRPRTASKDYNLTRLELKRVKFKGGR